MGEHYHTAVTPRQQAVILYAKEHPFENYGDYKKAADALGIPKNTIIYYAKQFQLNTRMPGPRTQLTVKQAVMFPVTRKEGTDLITRVRKHLTGNRSTKDELADMFNVAPKVIQEALDALTEAACALDCEDGRYGIVKDIRPPEEPVKETLEGLGARSGRFLIGATADWHVGSKYCRPDVINGLYDWYKKEGVSKVYLAGNWIDGEARFNAFDLDTHGMSAQVNKFIDICPRIPGITTEVLSGDDHEGWYVQREGTNIGQLLELTARKAGREDITDIGYMERDIELTPGQIMRVIHAGGGSAYATSYTAQKIVESLQGGEKPRVLLIGHFHKLSFEYPREVYCAQPGCAEDQTPWMRKKRLGAHVGGMILDVRVNDQGIIDEVGCRMKTWFDRKFYEYKW